MPASNFLKNLNGVPTEEAPVTSAAPNKIPATNGTNGQLDPSFMAGGAPINVSAGAGSAGVIPKLNAAGQIDASMLPSGATADTDVVPATETLAAGALVNLYSNAGVLSARNASGAAGSFKPAHGYVTAAVASSGSATVYRSGQITGLTGLTPGDNFLSTSTPGAAQSAAPASGSGYVSQKVGQALSASILDFQPQPPIQLL